jgi:outer membrane protein assembly factor BamB
MTVRTLLALSAIALLAGCHSERVRGLDAAPDAPDLIDFGLLPVNGRKVLGLKLANNGAISMVVKDDQSRADEPFALDSVPDSVDPGGDGTVLVAFEPVEPGQVQGQLVLATSSEAHPTVTVQLVGLAYSPELGANPTRLEFGDVEVGKSKSLDLVITNLAPVPLVPSLQKGGGDDFSSSPTGELGSLDPKGAVHVSVTFAPSKAGDQAGSLIMSCSVCADKPIELHGNGVQPAGPPPPPPVCTLQATPSRLDFGMLDPGQTANQSVQLKSVGTGTCFVSKPYLDSSSDASFSGLWAAAELAPNATTSLRVDFAPVAGTAPHVAGTLVIVSNDAASPASITLSGDVRPPAPPPPPPGKLQVVPASLKFTAQAPAAPTAQQLTLLNAGGTALTWAASENDAGMTLDATAGSLAPGQTATVQVSVAGQAQAGTRSATITVDAQEAGKVDVPVTIEFTAAPPPPPPPAQLQVTPLALSFSAEVLQTPPSQSITISNTGGLPMQWSAASDDPNLTVAASSGTVQGGSSTIASVSVATQQFVGVRTQKITVSAGAAGSADVTVTIEFKQTAPPPPPPQYGPSVWPKFHHDNGNTGLSQIDTSGTKGQLRWKSKNAAPILPPYCRQLSGVWRCGTYQASPSLAADGTVYQVGGDEYLYAFDRASGDVKWRTHVGEPMLASAESDVTVVKSGHVFIHAHGQGADFPQFFKIDDQGNIAWQNTPAGYDANGKRIDGFDSAPAIDYDDDLYLMNEDASKVGKWDQRSVKLFDVDLMPKIANSFTHGAALTTDKIAFWWGNGVLYAVDEAAGKNVLWSASDAALGTANLLHYSKSAPMITPDGKVVTAFAWRDPTSGKFYSRISAWQPGRTKKSVWTRTIGPTVGKKGIKPRDNRVNADEELRYNVGVSSPAMGLDGTIYVGHADGLYALDGATGKVKWSYGAASVVSSPAVGKDGTVYFGSMDGNLYAIKDGAFRWQVLTGGQVNSSPAIGDDGTIYAMSDDGYMYAVK